MQPVRGSLSIVCAIVVMIAACLTYAAAEKKAHPFHGTVEAVNKSARTLKVHGEKVEGWMDAMTMDYRVDDPSILDRVKPGDQILATVFDGDYSLHSIRLTGKSGGGAPPKP